ncbi:hypothetical protein HMPREF1548_04373 [Clostridium sp. KLE 1755]|nr:hypothetical protein HMPREF1548_04373 [Clostridium sp. KLE 1755]
MVLFYCHTPSVSPHDLHNIKIIPSGYFYKPDNRFQFTIIIASTLPCKNRIIVCHTIIFFK